MTTSDTDVIEAITPMVEGHSFLQLLGVEVRSASTGRVVLTLPHRDVLTNPDGETLHGGLAATLIDHASGMAVYTASLEDPGLQGGPTIDLRCSYVRPAKGDMHAEAEVVAVGNSIAFTTAEATVTTDGGEEVLVASGEGTFAVRRD